MVDETPFDENLQLSNRVLQKQIKAVTDAINENSKLTREYVVAALSPIEVGIEQLNSKMDQMLRKEKTKFNTQKLRDPMDNTLFPIFLCTAGCAVTYKK